MNGSQQTAKMKGSYTVDADCTGTITLKAGSTTYHFALIEVNGGQSLQLIDTDPGNIDVGVANPQ